MERNVKFGDVQIGGFFTSGPHTWWKRSEQHAVRYANGQEVRREFPTWQGVLLVLEEEQPAWRRKPRKTTLCD